MFEGTVSDVKAEIERKAIEYFHVRSIRSGCTVSDVEAEIERKAIEFFHVRSIRSGSSLPDSAEFEYCLC